MSRRNKAKYLNDKWGVGAKQPRYSKTYDGVRNWYGHLTRFPAALFDESGYILFDTEEEYKNCAGLTHGKTLQVYKGISSLDGYQRVVEKDKR